MAHALLLIRHVPAAAFLVALTLTSAPAWAQATAEQQQACAPDAIKLCSDTIPDIPRTTACMKAHVADLSPRCRSAFNEAVGGARKVAAASKPSETAKPRVATRVERAAPEPTKPTRHPSRTATLQQRPTRSSRASLDRAPTGSLPAVSPPAPTNDFGLASYEANLAQSCRAGLIDPFTCRNTLSVLNSLR